MKDNTEFDTFHTMTKRLLPVPEAESYCVKYIIADDLG